ncbi:MAG: hypothetical protein WC755_05505 [Candidatus Woesearchaeota archaeon]
MKYEVFVVIVFVLLVSLVLSGCQSKEKSTCDIETNQMKEITAEILNTKTVIDTSVVPSPEATIVTLRLSDGCTITALKELIEYKKGNAEDKFTKVDKVCIPEDSGTVSFNAFYRLNSVGKESYQVTPSLCSKTSEVYYLKLTE